MFVPMNTSLFGYRRLKLKLDLCMQSYNQKFKLFRVKVITVSINLAHNENFVHFDPLSGFRLSFPGDHDDGGGGVNYFINLLLILSRNAASRVHGRP